MLIINNYDLFTKIINTIILVWASLGIWKKNMALSSHLAKGWAGLKLRQTSSRPSQLPLPSVLSSLLAPGRTNFHHLWNVLPRAWTTCFCPVWTSFLGLHPDLVTYSSVTWGCFLNSLHLSVLISHGDNKSTSLVGTLWRLENIRQ